MWKLKTEQYFQVQDYILWDVIENGNSFKPVPRTTTNVDGTSTSTIPSPVTTEEKAQKKNDVKARSMLLMAFPNEHLLTFSQYKDAKTLFEAIQEIFAESNKADLITMSIDDLYNNFKIVKQEVKRTVVSSSSSGSPNMAFLSSSGSTNEVDIAGIKVSAFSTPVSTQIHEDDLEEMDLKWQLALLSIRARRYFQKTSKKIIINRSDTARYDKTKVECFSYHKMGHFARKCRSPRNQESMPRNQDSLRKTMIMEDTSSKAIEAIDGAGLGFTSYSAVAPPPTGLFAPPSIDLSNSGLKEFQHPEFKGYGPNDEDESEEMVLKSDNAQHKPEQANQPRNMAQKHVLKNMKKGTIQRDVRPVWNNAMRTNHQNFSNSRKNFTPTVVLTKSGIVPISTARQSSSRAATPVSAARPINTAASKPLVNVAKPRSNVFQKSHSLSKRPFYQQTAPKNRNLNNNVNAVKANSVNIAKGNKVTSVVGNRRINAIKHMIGNISYLTDFKEHDRGYVAFRKGAKGGKITSKGTIRTEKIDFDDVYFVKELQFNIF
nr:ribonuclease H-like domain-containing protein [Tanacetum cinerariifolium]